VHGDLAVILIDRHHAVGGKRNFIPGRAFRDLADFNQQLVQWLAGVADVRVHGTTHERPIDRFAREASALVSTLDQPSSFQALRRERVVAEDWLVAIDANRYSVPWRLNAAQLKRLGEHLLKLRLFKSRERLEALLQEAAAKELAYSDFLEQVLSEEVAAKTSKNVQCARRWRAFRL
jgi:hypothetical protein